MRVHIHYGENTFDFVPAFDPAEHPHAPAGAPESKGGQFVKLAKGI